MCNFLFAYEHFTFDQILSFNEETVLANLLLNYFLYQVLKLDHPEATARAFCPTLKDIRNYSFTASRELMLSKIDQGALQLQIDKWSGRNESPKIFFRPHIAAKSPKQESGNIKEELEEVLGSNPLDQLEKVWYVTSSSYLTFINSRRHIHILVCISFKDCLPTRALLHLVEEMLHT